MFLADPTRPDFLVLTANVIVAVLVILLATGLFFEILNARHPARRIQATRSSLTRRRELTMAPGSIVTLSLCFAFGLYAQWKGWALTPVSLAWWNAIPLLLLSVVLYDAWFFWVHNLLHSRLFYRFHRLHHTSVAPSVWTNHHETVFEAFLNQAYYALIVFVLPIPWQILVVQKLYDQVSGMLGHAGFEHFASSGARSPWPLASTVFHDQHHSSFRHNFAHTFSWWDRWAGTLHPRYDAVVHRFEQMLSK